MRRWVSAALVAAVVAVFACVPIGSASAAPRAVRILITGDSITQGSSGDYTWRYRLWAKLARTAPGGAVLVGPRRDLYDVVHDRVGATGYAQPFPGDRHGALWGDSLRDATPRIGRTVAEADPDVLVVLLGGNDLAYLGSPQDAAARLRRYLGRARAAHPGLDVVIGEVPDRYDVWTRTRLLSEATRRYATLIRAVAADLDTASARVVVAPVLHGWDPAAHTWDGTHPNPTGEALIAQRVSEALARLGVGTAAPSIAGARSWAVPGPAVRVSTSGDAATLSWDRAPTGASGMFVEMRSVSAGEGWHRLPFPVAADRWTAAKLAVGGTYEFRLVPTKGSSTGRHGPPTRVVFPGRAPGPVGAITVLGSRAGTWGGQQVTALWNAARGAAAYLTSYQLADGGARSWTDLPYPVTGRSWTFEPLLTGRHYRYRVRSTHGYLRGPWSTSAPARTHGLPDGAAQAALGDSYSSGLGSSGSDSGGHCHRNPHAWGFLLRAQARLALTLQACAGARVGGVRDQITSMNRFFAARPGRPQLITLTIGGNDVGFSRSLKDCVTGDCTGAESLVSSRITRLGPVLRRLYADLRAAHPYADIVVGGYPDVIEPSGRSTNVLCGRLQPAERAMITRLAGRLNSTIQTAAAAAGVGTVGTAVARRFAGHNACSRPAREWIHAGVFNPFSPFFVDGRSFHPNDRGQAAYAKVFEQTLQELAR